MPEGSEPWPGFVGRVVAALGALAAGEGRRLVVAHAGVLRAVASVCGLGSERVANPEGRWLTLDGGRLTGVGALVPDS